MKKLRAFYFTLMVAIVMIATPYEAFAAKKGGNDSISQYLSEIKSIPAALQGKIEIEDKDSGDKYDENYQYYNVEIDGEEKRAYVANKDRDEVVAIIKKLKVNNEAVEEFKEITDNLGLKPDTDTAMDAFKGIRPFLNMILGIVVSIVTAGMTIFTALDICYLAFPVFRNSCDEAKQTGQSTNFANSVKTDAKTGETKLRFITDDAQHAIVSSNTVETGKSPFLIYIKARALAFIFVSMALFLLVTGRIDIIINIVLKAISGLLDLISVIGM